MLMLSPESLEQYPVVSRCARLRFDRQTGAYVLLSPERGLKLNSSAGFVLQRCNGRLSIAEIVDEVLIATTCDESQRLGVTADVLELLDTLAQRGLVALKDAP